MNQEDPKFEESGETPETNEMPEVVELTREQALEAEVAQLKDQWLRALADAENLRKRMERDKDEARKFAVTAFSRDLLSVSDNLRRALESCPMTDALPEAVRGLIQGVEMTEQELLNCFERHGIRLVNPLNEPFDPNFHQAMFEVETAEQPAGIVMQVMQVGYVIHDRLLRPAMVGVTKAKSV